MGLRGPKPKGKVRIKWSADFAYAMGLLATDGNLSPDGRHISFVSKDIEQINNFLTALKIVDIKIGKSLSGDKERWAYRVQFGDVLFYDFLKTIGIRPAKSKTIGKVLVPKKFFFDYLRGCLDGDGCTYSYWDPRWKSSFMFYTEFVSASKKYIIFLQKEIFDRLKIKGHITNDGRKRTLQLKYAKKDSLKILKKIYANRKGLYLKRKRLKIDKAFTTIGWSLD